MAIEKGTSFDPVCGVIVPMADDTLTSEYKGKIYRFCCQACREEFEIDPDSYHNDAEADEKHEADCALNDKRDES